MTQVDQGLIPSWTCICGQCHERVTYHYEAGRFALTLEEALHRLKQQGWTRDGNRWLCRFCSLCSQVEAHLATLSAEERRMLLDPLEEPDSEPLAIKGTFEVYRAGKRITVPASVVLRQGKRVLLEYLYHGNHGDVVQRWLRNPADYARFTPSEQTQAGGGEEEEEVHVS